MKKAIISVLLLLLFASAWSQEAAVKPKPKQQTSVLICKSKNAYAYHKEYCAGLKKCKAAVETLTKAKAEEKGYTPCGFCYGKSTGKTGKTKNRAIK